MFIFIDLILQNIRVIYLHLLGGKIRNRCFFFLQYYSHVLYLKQINLIMRNVMSGYESLFRFWKMGSAAESDNHRTCCLSNLS